MGGELDVRGGGAVAVDTETLRMTAARFLEAGAELEALSRRVGSLQLMLLEERARAWDAASATSVLATRLNGALGGATRIADALREAAVVYELVELNAEHRAGVLSGDRAVVAQVDRRRNELLALHPEAFASSIGAEFERTVLWPGDIVRQATELGYAFGEHVGPEGAVYGGAGFGLLALGLGVGAGVTGQGRIAADARLTNRGAPVALTSVPPVRTPTAAPTSLAAVASRMPGAGDSRVRVERYTMRDGSSQYAVYVAGMQSMAVGGDDPWDNLSNAQLYAGSASASYEATESALAAAGARPGDVVHAFGHSQGAMITAHLALEGGYDTRTLVTFGSPVEADVGATTLSVGVRHTDDPVAALAGGGHIAPVGSAGSFVVEREADPAAGLHDARVPGHRMQAYAETSAMIDASSDPRIEAVRSVFEELGRAESVEVREFAATRGP
ncbi:hypothetical protein [Microbacterium sp. CFBP9034]|uniref:hypothetical protein n=1 Tax=Microbacterium sp. CFBP9034 TaxID=3096540 RepID=UPI002A6AAB6E|nr:hypothetical protein [Microbacterium sp. CFBP9034]MDY0908148.1 hypothetical protein [Microbacterium sp. CFBP9034]